ncbi:MAG: SPOR domain-containing protein [Microbacter sp.]
MLQCFFPFRPLLTILGLWVGLATSYSQQLLNKLEAPDGVTQASVTIHQSDRITRLVFQHASSAEPTAMQNNVVVTPKSTKIIPGFRVQVFSSSNVKTAKDNAFAMQDAVLEALPDTPVYVVFNAPFWKVRVGNCRNHDEAQKLKEIIIKALPQVQQVAYIVRDSVLISK